MQFMTRAYELAQYAEHQGEVPVGAVVVYQQKIVGEGYNCPISSHDPTAHAEIMALRQAAHTLNNYRLVDCTVYTTLEPCAMCAAALVHARIKDLVYGAQDPKAGAIVSTLQLLDHAHFNHQVTHQGGVMAEACGQLLKDFFTRRR